MDPKRFQTIVSIGLLITVGIAGFLAFYATGGQLFKTALPSQISDGVPGFVKTNILEQIKAEAVKYAPLPDLAQKITGIETIQLKTRHKEGNDALTAAQAALTAGDDAAATASMNSAILKFSLSEYLKTDEGTQVFAKVNADAEKTGDVINSAGGLLNKYKGDDKDLLLLSHQGIAGIYAQKVADNIGKEALLNTLGAQTIIYEGLAKDVLPSLASSVKDTDLEDAVSNYDFVYKKTVVLDIEAPVLKIELDALKAEFAKKVPAAAKEVQQEEKKTMGESGSAVTIPGNSKSEKKVKAEKVKKCTKTKDGKKKCVTLKKSASCKDGDKGKKCVKLKKTAKKTAKKKKKPSAESGDPNPW